MSDITLNVTCVAPVPPATNGTLSINHGTGTDGDFSLDTNDTLKINVSLGEGIASGHTYNYQFQFTKGGNPTTSPLTNDSGTGETIGTDLTVGSECFTGSETLNYTLTITYDGVDYVSDPQLQINQPPSA